MSYENEVPSDEQVARSIIYKDDFFKQYSEIVPEVGERLERYVFDIRDALSALRASWEKDIDKLRSDHTEYEKIINSEYAKVKALEAEKKGLEDRVREQEYFIGSLHNYDGDAKRLLEETVAENRRLKAENAELKETLQGNICAYCLKHEVEDCPHNPNKRVLETGPAGEGRAFLKETTTIEKLQAERDSLTIALAEAREWIEKNGDYAFTKEILSNPASQRASEEMMGLRKRMELMWEVVTYANTVRNDILIPETDDQVEMSCQCKEWVDGLLERLKALEAYERGKV